MTKKIFRSFMVSAAAVLLAAVAIVMTCLYSYFASVQENQLQDQLQLAAAAVETQGRDYLNKLTADRYRLTWIAPDGAVLCDTKRDAESLENHGDRLEVREALRTGSGHSTRYSSTLLEKTSYYARRMPDGTVLRISISRATVGMLLLGMLPAILLTAAVALILSGLLAGRLSRRITAPLNALDLEHPLENDTYEELSPLLCRINVQRRQIDSQLTDLRRRVPTDHLPYAGGPGAAGRRRGRAEHQPRRLPDFRGGRDLSGPGFPDGGPQPGRQRRIGGSHGLRPQRGPCAAPGPYLSVRYLPHPVWRRRAGRGAAGLRHHPAGDGGAEPPGVHRQRLP